MAGGTSEFELIARIRARAGTRDDVVLGIGDDAAILRVTSDHDLVVSTDTLISGVHFPPETLPFDVGWKSLAVSLSDLAAMGAQPAWCTLNLTMPEGDGVWLDPFVDGLLALAARFDVALVGGDTTRGPLSITVTVHGFVPRDAALLRSAAKGGDEVWVSGTLGDASGALRQWRAGAPIDALLRERLDRPSPRVALGLALRGIAHACIDVSDGLLADLSHVLRASGKGAEIDRTALPTSPGLAAAFEESARIALQLAGGDDYELCFTAPAGRNQEVLAASRKAGTVVTRIGRIDAGVGLRVRDIDGVVREASAAGYLHFHGSTV